MIPADCAIITVIHYVMLSAILSETKNIGERRLTGTIPAKAGIQIIQPDAIYRIDRAPL